MKEKTRKLSGFAKGLLIYAAVFILIAGAALGLLYGFVSAYEESRPYNSIESYLSGIDAAALPQGCEDFIMTLDENIRPADESRAILADMLRSAEYAKDVAASSSQRIIYSLKADGIPLGFIHMVQSSDSSFGFSVWELAEENFDFSGISKKISMDIPADYSISINGARLGKENIKDKAVPYETLLSCYEYYDTLPCLVHYESGSYIGEAEVKVFDAEGKVVSEDELNESVYLNNCSSEKEKELKDFSDEVIRRYVQLCANIDQNEVGNYMHMKELIIPQSQLHDRMRISFYALGYSTIRSCKILSTDMKICTDLGNGKYFTDLSYSVETWGLADPVTTEQSIQLVLSYDSLNQLKAEAMFNY